MKNGWKGRLLKMLMFILHTMLFISTVVEILSVSLLLAIAADIAWYSYTTYKREKPIDKTRILTKGRKAIMVLNTRTTAKTRRTSTAKKAAKAKEDAKAKLREQKEAEASESGDFFFEEPYIRGFDTTGNLKYLGKHRSVSSEEAEAYYREMDALVDTQLFKNIEEL